MSHPVRLKTVPADTQHVQVEGQKPLSQDALKAQRAMSDLQKEQNSAPGTIKRERVRCQHKPSSETSCNRKLSLTEEITNRCACEKVFCNSHRDIASHNCSAKKWKQLTDEEAKAKVKAEPLPRRTNIHYRRAFQE